MIEKIKKTLYNSSVRGVHNFLTIWMKQNMEKPIIEHFVTAQKITIPLSFSNQKSEEKSYYHFSYLLNP